MSLKIEVKYIIDREDYLKLLEYFSLNIEDRFTQLNEYFDTPNRQLMADKMMLRIRSKKVGHKLTLKVPEGEGLMEYNVPLPYEQYLYIKQTGKITSLPINQSKFVQIGELTTHRIKTSYLQGEIFLDENHYNGIVDYEVEYEVPNDLEQAERIVIDLFKKANVTSYHKSLSKMKRACK